MRSKCRLAVFVLVMLCMAEAVQVTNTIHHQTQLQHVITHLTQHFSKLHRFGANSHRTVNAILDASPALSKSIQAIALQAAKHPNFVRVVQSALQTVTGERELVENVPDVSLLQLSSAANDDSQVIGSCLFRTFDGIVYQPNNTVIESSTTTPTSEDCRQKCVNAPTCIGYDWSIRSECRWISSFATSALYDSAVCVRRGGCDGQGESSECVWMPLPDTDVANVLSVVAIETNLTVVAEETCRAMCEDYLGERCIAYRFGKWGETRDLCSYYMQASLSVTSDSGMCLRGMEFTKVPSSCWAGQSNCEQQPKLSVPPMYGDPVVTLSVAIPDSLTSIISPLSTVALRAAGGEASFSNIRFDDDGDVVLRATAEGIECPAYSKSFFVDSAERHTLFRFQSGFPTDGPFWIVQPKRSCTHVVLILAILGLIGVVFAFKMLWSVLFFRIKQVPVLAVVLGILAVFIRDYGISYSHWKCNDHFSSSFQFLNYIPGVTNVTSSFSE